MGGSQNATITSRQVSFFNRYLIGDVPDPRRTFEVHASVKSLAEISRELPATFRLSRASCTCRNSLRPTRTSITAGEGLDTPGIPSFAENLFYVSKGESLDRQRGIRTNGPEEPREWQGSNRNPRSA